MENNVFRVNKLIEKYFLYGIIFVVLLGTLSHFIFDWFNNEAIGIFVPVNESVWEHLKLVFWPILFYLYGGYFILRRKNKIDTRRFFYYGLSTIYFSCAIILVVHYVYKGIFGGKTTIIDIIAFVVSITISFTIAAKNYTNTPVNKSSFDFINYATILLVILVIIFTFYPPHIPLFYDFSNKLYGINLKG